MEEFTLKNQSLGFKNQVISKLSKRFQDPSWLGTVWHCSTSLYLGSWAGHAGALGNKAHWRAEQWGALARWVAGRAGALDSRARWCAGQQGALARRVADRAGVSGSGACWRVRQRGALVCWAAGRAGALGSRARWCSGQRGALAR
ncbi:unnamed protein product [Closterium sp. NIES-53]